MHTFFEKCNQDEKSVLVIKVSCKYLATLKNDFEVFMKPQNTEKAITVDFLDPQPSFTISIDARKIRNITETDNDFRMLCAKLNSYQHGITAKEKGEIRNTFDEFMRKNNLDCAKTSHVYSGTDGGGGFCR